MKPSPSAILSILSLAFLPQAYQANQPPPSAYYQSYHYSTTNHP
jgi:hypothetical protein